MTWTDTDVGNLILVGKDIGVHLAESICRKLTLGKSISQDIDYLYLICNIVFALEHSYYGATPTFVFEDTDYDLMNEYLNRIEITRNRFRGL